MFTYLVSAFRYMLYRSRTKSDSSIDTYLDRFVLFEHREDLLRFALRFPVKGTFKMDIYGLDVNVSDIFDLCCSYVIECSTAKKNCLPLPDCPPLGWGPVTKTKEAGLKPVSHNKAQVGQTAQRLGAGHEGQGRIIKYVFCKAHI
jgi:hypothetical protein